MKPLPLALLILTSLLMAAANLLVKTGLARAGKFTFSREGLRSAYTQPILLCGVALVAFSSVLWLYVLSRAPMTTVYPTFIGVTYLLIVAGSILLLQERLGWGRSFGIALILAGVLLVARPA